MRTEVRRKREEKCGLGWICADGRGFPHWDQMGERGRFARLNAKPANPTADSRPPQEAGIRYDPPQSTRIRDSPSVISLPIIPFPRFSLGVFRTPKVLLPETVQNLHTEMCEFWMEKGFGTNCEDGVIVNRFGRIHRTGQAQIPREQLAGNCGSGLLLSSPRQSWSVLSA